MMQNKEEIDALIVERVKEGPNKVQFHIEVAMIKIPTVQDGDTGYYKISIQFLNTKTSPETGRVRVAQSASIPI